MKTVSDFLIERLSAWGVSRIYGYAGDGINGVIDEPGKIGSTLDSALASRRPAVVEIVADPNIPPLPPHTTAKQAKDYLLALMKGDPMR